jgi:hypothetical protein
MVNTVPGPNVLDPVAVVGDASGVTLVLHSVMSAQRRFVLAGPIPA